MPIQHFLPPDWGSVSCSKEWSSAEICDLVHKLDPTLIAAGQSSLNYKTLQNNQFIVDLGPFRHFKLSLKIVIVGAATAGTWNVSVDMLNAAGTNICDQFNLLASDETDIADDSTTIVTMTWSHDADVAGDLDSVNAGTSTALATRFKACGLVKFGIDVPIASDAVTSANIFPTLIAST